jgi:hypothetical protein
MADRHTTLGLHQITLSEATKMILSEQLKCSDTSIRSTIQLDAVFDHIVSTGQPDLDEYLQKLLKMP